ncbi:MAG: integrase core domain-containing protein [Dehalococcoidia bacterium]
MGKAREIIGRWVAFYNQKRLHAGLKYLTPQEYWEGEPNKRLEERRQKLARARKRREEINRARLQAAA